MPGRSVVVSPAALQKARIEREAEEARIREAAKAAEEARRKTRIPFVSSVFQNDVREMFETSEKCISSWAQQISSATEACMFEHANLVEQANSLVMNHVEAMCIADEAHNLEAAKLRAENAMLREQVSILTTTLPNLFQEVLLSAEKTGPRIIGSSAQAKKNHGIKSANSSKSSPTPAVGGVTTKPHALTQGGESMPLTLSTATAQNKRNSRVVPGGPTSLSGHTVKETAPGEPGSWQTIVAWVPSTLKAPESWQPLTADVVNSLGQIAAGKLPKTSEITLSSPHTTTIGPQHAFGIVPTTVRESVAVIPGEVVVDECETTKFPEDKDEKETEHEASEKRFEVDENWQRTKKSSTPEQGKKKSAVKRVVCKTASALLIEDEDEHIFAESKPPVWMVHPHSTRRMCWDVGSLMMVIYDFLTIPLFFFDIPENFFLIIMDWMSRLFWSFDVVWSCVTGISLGDGSVNMELRNIIVRYLKTWFLLDLLIVSSDWMEFVLTNVSMSKAGLLVKSSRAMRVIRVIRLMRLVRMRQVIDLVTERIQSDRLVLLVNNCKIVLFMLVFAHVSGCIWWGIGNRDFDGLTWAEHFKFKEKPVESQYLICLHWALMSLQGGMSEIAPMNGLERLYAVFHFVCSFMIAAIMVSVLTSNLTQSHIVRGHQSQCFMLLRTYLKQNSISNNLALRVQRSAQHAISGDVTPEGVELLNVVSEPLQIEMHFEMYSALLCEHPLFSQYNDECPQAMRRVCHCAMATVWLSHGDVVFSEGEPPSRPKVFFIVNGTAEYEDEDGEITILQEKQWVAEPSLWSKNWVHRGTFSVTSDLKLAILCGTTFANIANQYIAGGNFDPRDYAYEYVKHMCSLDEVNDLVRLPRDGVPS
eukprot:TRINITY_DN48891_c0_g1_i1.p1 TRINITY_DN48891_c0_g1~~TRINITY_DN48891_c0_g1_i1.p1  ORF type:complete len:872 (+),score=112.23 TRINITY_DN48891_c0_g1_i1:173-2788(+)